MVRNGGDEEESSQTQRASMPSSSSRYNRARTSDPFLLVCKCFSFLASFAAILCIFINVLSAFRSFKNGSDIFDGIFRCYAVAIALFVVVAETEWGFVLNFWRILEYWAGRGMLQIFVAVMTRAFPDVNGVRKDLVLLQDISSYLLLACGVTYVISGVLCIGFLKRNRQSKEITRNQAVKDLEELNRRKEELEALLVMERA
ncbi:Golgi apparatus membrane protein TVP15 [Macleaya cordata]|uniref:Golgi apparatus membrane protein TVP15 n=1 Tax=Macleaya cordata TaxID=56857 RepID=A0A200QK44_MACCD|nr:Golgi apparatus membrane protein TVP15 [Macleaya cordata]